MAKKDHIYLDEYEEPEHLLGDKDIEEQLFKVYQNVAKGFQDGSDRVDTIVDYWDIYNCKLNEKQTYNGESQVFVPLVHNALNARKTRFVNQIFPVSGRHVECITVDGGIPDGILSLVEH